MSALVQENKSLFQILSNGISALSSVARVDIVIAFRVVEFLDAGRDNPISRHRLPIIDRRLGYIQAEIGSGRNVLEQILREPISNGLRNEVHDRAIAMGELKILVNPGLRFSPEVPVKAHGPIT